uniref:Aldehyde oxidase GLOX n=1 Tax=Tanacetum cinerariifolium TaxID=118510 RepID=A0A6L2J5H4_TANCI|nr:aldehyde oxidase GLOX [Tanacetum cinerariifolium]
MVILPNIYVIIINGAGSGKAGWDNDRDPMTRPMIYHPNNLPNTRFSVMQPTSIHRLYNSGATLITDGRVLVAGRNPNQFYNFTNVEFPIDLRLEAFSPPYLTKKNAALRHVIVSLDEVVEYKKQLMVTFTVVKYLKPAKNLHYCGCRTISDRDRTTRQGRIYRQHRAKETTFPVLSRMAMDILSVQATSVAFESAFSTSGRVLSIRRTRLTLASLEMCMCLKDHLDAQEYKQDKSTLKTPVDFEEEILDVEVQANEAIPLSDKEIALDAASSEGSMSGPGSGGEEAEVNYGYDVYHDDY